MTHFCEHILYIINEFVELATISGIYVVLRLPNIFLQRPMASTGASIMPLGLPPLMDKPTLCWPSCAWNSRSGTAGLLFQRNHTRPTSVDRSEGSGTDFYKYDWLDDWTCGIDCVACIIVYIMF